MEAHLSLVRGEGRIPPSFAPPPRLLDPGTQRPGELAGLVELDVDRALVEHLEQLAAVSGLPVALVATINVEAERVLGELSTLGLDRPSLVADLDAAAQLEDDATIAPRRLRALRGYAAALRSGGYRARTEADTSLVLTVPDRLLACWSAAAQQNGITLETWVAGQLGRSAPGREAWEARAAYEARTLAEWATLQALRRFA
jgi:hypothetical protein